MAHSPLAKRPRKPDDEFHILADRILLVFLAACQVAVDLEYVLTAKKPKRARDYHERIKAGPSHATIHEGAKILDRLKERNGSRRDSLFEQHAPINRAAVHRHDISARGDDSHVLIQKRRSEREERVSLEDTVRIDPENIFHPGRVKPNVKGVCLSPVYLVDNPQFRNPGIGVYRADRLRTKRA